MQTSAKMQPEVAPKADIGQVSAPGLLLQGMRKRAVLRLSLLWRERGFLSRAAVFGLLLGTLLAFVPPKRFESTVQLMPPDTQSNSALPLPPCLPSPPETALPPSPPYL